MLTEKYCSFRHISTFIFFRHSVQGGPKNPGLLSSSIISLTLATKKVIELQNRPGFFVVNSVHTTQARFHVGTGATVPNLGLAPSVTRNTV